MERIKSLRTLVYMISALLGIEIIFLIFQVRPNSFSLWITIAVIAISCTYLVAMTLGLLKELKDRMQNGDKE